MALKVISFYIPKMLNVRRKCRPRPFFFSVLPKILKFCDFSFSGMLDLQTRLYTAQKTKFSIKDFFSKCDQMRSFLRIWSHLLKKSLMENFIFCAVTEPFVEIVCRFYSLYIFTQRSIINVKQVLKYASETFLNNEDLELGSSLKLN